MYRHSFERINNTGSTCEAQGKCHPESCLTTFAKIFDFTKNVRFPAGSNHRHVETQTVRQCLMLAKNAQHTLTQCHPELVSGSCHQYIMTSSENIKNISYTSRTAKRQVRRNYVNAFTLAEVLITLGIIGVVAAMTLPALINKTNNIQYKAQLQKAYSVISQALTRLNTDQGYIANQENYGAHKFAPAIKKYLIQAKDCNATDCQINGSDDTWGLLLSDVYTTYNGHKGYNANFDEGQSILTDGMFIMIDNDGYNPISISVDVNGYYKRPNRFGFDVFMFQIDNTTGKLLPMGADGTRYPYREYCSTTSTRNVNGLGCTIKALTEPDYFKNLPK